jgi:hypothetical protein
MIEPGPIPEEVRFERRDGGRSVLTASSEPS